MSERRKEYTIAQIEEMANGSAYHSEPAMMLRQLLKDNQSLRAVLARVKEWMEKQRKDIKTDEKENGNQGDYYVGQRWLLSKLKEILEEK
jgi:hypothetical protein